MQCEVDMNSETLSYIFLCDFIGFLIVLIWCFTWFQKKNTIYGRCRDDINTNHHSINKQVIFFTLWITIFIVLREYGVDYSTPVDLNPWKWHDVWCMYNTINLLSQCAVKLDCFNQYLPTQFWQGGSKSGLKIKKLTDATDHFRGAVNQTARLPMGAIYLLWLITLHWTHC